jgi:M6 family metalloprotease-like protein
MKRTSPHRPWKSLALLALASMLNATVAALFFAGPLSGERAQVGPAEDMVIPTLAAVGSPQAELAQTVTGAQNWLTLLCRFADVSGDPRPPNFFKEMFERTSGPSLSSYWNEASYGAVPSITTDVSGWHTLPNPRAHYGFSETVAGFNVGLIVEECAATADAANPALDFTQYDAVGVMVNAPTRVAIASFGNVNYPDGAQMQFGTMVIPSDKYNLALVAHEMGHTYGLPHSSANGQEYQNPWDLMGIVSGYRCAVNADPVYSCLGQHPIGKFKDDLGWIPANRLYEAPNGTNTITLERLALPQTDNYLLARITTPGGTYTVEARQPVGFDAKLADTAVLIHRGNDLIDADATAPYDDEGAIWRPGETFNAPENGVSIRVDTATPTGFTVTITNTNTPPAPPQLIATLSANPAVPEPGATVTLTTMLAYSPSTFGVTGARVTMSFPQGLTYVPNSAQITSGLGTIVSQNPLVVDFDSITTGFGASFSVQATIAADLTEPTVLTAPVAIEWDNGTVNTAHGLIINGQGLYLPLQQR